MLIKIWYHLSRRRRKQFWLLLILMIISSLSEIISIGAVLPFLGVLAAPENTYNHELIQPLVRFFEFTAPDQLIFPLTVVFVAAALLAGVVRMLLLYVMTRLSYAAGADLSIDIYRRTLYQDYSVHISRNSSEIINGIISKTSTVIGGILTPMLILISSFILLVGIMGLLLAINIQVALVAFIGFGGMYWLVIRYTRQLLKENSKCVAEKSTLMIQSLQEGLGAIRDVLIDGNQQFYCQLYRDSDLPLRRAQGNNVFISGSPRYAMEAIGVTLIAGLAYLMTMKEGGMLVAMPVLGALALGAQRLLPVLQQAYSAYSSIKGAYSSFKDVLPLLDQPLPGYAGHSDVKSIDYEEKIELEGVGFRYAQGGPWILRDVDLRINKGDRVGFIGTTGSGKSTLLNIIMGLLTKSEGEFKVDGKTINNENVRSWQNRISHVPQNIFLSDSTIEENIAFGIPKEKINRQKVEEAARQAQLEETINAWRDGYNARVGECGVQLSGGQRQRVGIARALYRQADVLILDEATSALDGETELAVMESIEGLGKDLTILIIAHRYSTLKSCNKIVELIEGDIKVCAYNDLFNGEQIERAV